jgi:hypothetical protein
MKAEFLVKNWKEGGREEEMERVISRGREGRGREGGSEREREGGKVRRGGEKESSGVQGKVGGMLKMVHFLFSHFQSSCYNVAPCCPAFVLWPSP